MTATTALHAQAAAPAGPQGAFFRTLSLSLDTDINGLYYDHRGRKTPVSATNLNLSAPYAANAGGTISLYREVPPPAPEAAPLKQPVADVSLEGSGPWLVVMTSQPNTTQPPQVRAHAFDHSWQSHPAATVRIFNFCSGPVTFQLNSQTINLAPGQSHLFPYPEQNHQWLKVASPVDGEWGIRLSAPQRIGSKDTRATWALFERPVTLENPTPRIFVRNLIEPVPTTLQ